MGAETLDGLLRRSAARFAERPAVEEPGGAVVTYGELDAWSDGLAERLVRCGVRPGDRVGIDAPKSVHTVAAIFGILKAKAAYVPVDPTAPPLRNAYIFENCGVAAIVVHRDGAEPLSGALADGLELVDELRDAPPGRGGLVLGRPPGRRKRTAPGGPDERLAYILYTSGSTGRPKGVMHSHRTALAFVDWCSEELGPVPEDRFSAHAPFHFDLSILDLYVPIKHGARIVLIGEDLGKQPIRLAPVIAESRITVWYSTPSVLRLLREFGKMDGYDYSSLRIVNFAGEVFPPKHFRALREVWPAPRYYNLYGPTETNVCSYYAVPAGAEPDEPFPIGRACSGDELRVVDEHGAAVPDGEEGELVVSGGSVMLGYWALPEQNERAFLEADGRRWYRTGDVVRRRQDGELVFLGRRDRMVKKRGYRVELGEIESALYRHPEIAEAAVVAVADAEGAVTVKAYLNWTGAGKPSLVALKRFCAENLPAYMIPDRFTTVPSLPKTSTDKVDYQRLKELG